MRIAPFILAAATALLAPMALAQDAVISDEARAHFQAGVNFMQDPDGARYEEAYREFSAAYRSSPSWKILGNLGIAAMKLERDGEAIDAFEKYLAAGGSALAADEIEQFQRDLGTLKAGVVRLSLEVSEPGAIILDERLPVAGSAVRNTYAVDGQRLDVGVRSGHHRITARLAGFEDDVWEIDAVSGAPQSHAFRLKRPSAAPPVTSGVAAPSGARPTPAGVYVGLVTTGAFAVGAGVVGAIALKKKANFNDANDGSNPAHAKTLHDGVRTFNLITDVLLGAAVVSAGVTTYLYLSRPEKDSVASGFVRIQPQLGLQTSTLQLEGAF